MKKNQIKTILAGMVAVAVTVGQAQAGLVTFATATGGSLSSSSGQLKLDMVGDYNSGAENDWADKFGDRGQFYFDFNLSSFLAIDGNQTQGTKTAGSVQWAINDIKSGVVYNSILRGTVGSYTEQLNGSTVTFSAVLLTDGLFHGYGDWNKNGDVADDVELLSLLPVGTTLYQTDGKVYVSGTLTVNPTTGVMTPNAVTFSFGVPDVASSASLMGMAIVGLGAFRRWLK
jgi:hypothetical protein